MVRESLPLRYPDGPPPEGALLPSDRGGSGCDEGSGRDRADDGVAAPVAVLVAVRGSRSMKELCAPKEISSAWL